MQESEALSKQPRYALNTLERTYLDACVSQRTRSVRQRRNRNVLLAAISVLLVLAIMGALVLLGVNQQQLINRLPVSVTKMDDSKQEGSLRYAIDHASDGAAITFATILSGSHGEQCDTKTTRCTITLTEGELKIAKNLTISGPDAQHLTISGGYSTRVFEIGPNFTVTLSNLTIDSGFAKFNAQDSSPGRGGGILCDDSCTLTMMNSVVSHNRANNGGGIENFDGTLMLVNSTISDNTANDGGGGIDNNGSLTLSKSTISRNIAHRTGRGIKSGGGSKDLYNYDLTITNSTLSGNQAYEGGGIYAVTISTFIYFSTIYDNTAAKSGGVSISGIGSIDQSIGARQEIDTSIIANNHAPPPTADIVGTITIEYPPDWIQDPSGANFRDVSDKRIDPHDSSRILSGPLPLGPLGNNDGLTATYPLNPGSPAIGKVSASACSASGIPTDQRNMPRPRTPGGKCDLGAYEVS